MATKKTTTTGPDLSVFSVEVSPALIAQAIHVYRENSHRGISKTKSRGEINATKKKVYKQKGTGNARHGARSAPIYVGGGVTFGPKGLKLALKTLNQKMKVKALLGVLSLYNKESRLLMVNPSDIKDNSTKSAQKALGTDKASFIYHEETPGILKAVSNLPSISVMSARRLNAYTTATAPKVFLTPSAANHLITRLKLK